jgi:hypothetical protein
MVEKRFIGLWFAGLWFGVWGFSLMVQTIGTLPAWQSTVPNITIIN